ncbi:ester cyclase [Pseudomonas saliphila]|uniref:ester cyclase n=1 Tax=Pseudomonas saliphila TaxID=2586906 RepID=UPI00123C2994|nr:ester cyclase [Pseudomonas saliphila]
MNIEWEQSWLELFDDNLEALMAHYPNDFEYEDMNLGVRIVNDKNKLRELFGTFENRSPDASLHYFNASRYHGDENGGALEWTWEIEHKSDFLGLPAAGKVTKVTGITIHKFRDQKIILERSLWDTAALLQQLGLPAPAKLQF